MKIIKTYTVKNTCKLTPKDVTAELPPHYYTAVNDIYLYKVPNAWISLYFCPQ